MCPACLRGVTRPLALMVSVHQNPFRSARSPALDPMAGCPGVRFDRVAITSLQLLANHGPSTHDPSRADLNCATMRVLTPIVLVVEICERIKKHPTTVGQETDIAAASIYFYVSRNFICDFLSLCTDSER